MDSTRRTTEMLSKGEMDEAFDAWSRGYDVGRLATRYGVYPVELQAALERERDERERERQESERAESQRRGEQPYTLGDLHNALFRQLHALQAVDVRDDDALQAVVEQTKGVEGLAKQITDNGRLVLEAAKLRASFANQVAQVPRMLEG